MIGGGGISRVFCEAATVGKSRRLAKVYLADETPVSCPTCGHFVSYSVDHCGTCDADLSRVDLKALGEHQWQEGEKRRNGFWLLTILILVCWSAVYFIN